MTIQYSHSITASKGDPLLSFTAFQTNIIQSLTRASLFLLKQNKSECVWEWKYDCLYNRRVLVYPWKFKIISNYSVVDQLPVHLAFVNSCASPLIHCDYPNIYVSNRQIFYKYLSIYEPIFRMGSYMRRVSA